MGKRAKCWAEEVGGKTTCRLGRRGQSKGEIPEDGHLHLFPKMLSPQVERRAGEQRPRAQVRRPCFRSIPASGRQEHGVGEGDPGDGRAQQEHRGLERPRAARKQFRHRRVRIGAVLDSYISPQPPRQARR